MFSGLVEDLGEVREIEGGPDGARLRIGTGLAPQISLGDSVAVNGVCLTATEVGPDSFAADAMHQTLRLTSIGALEPGGGVNLELALRADARLGGHIVQGHVDGTGRVAGTAEDGFARRVRISLGPELMRYVVPRGSITIEGVSLTVAAAGEGWAEVSLIPETLERTTLGRLAEGDAVNVECDVIAKYVERMVSPYGAWRPDRPPQAP